MSYFNSDIGLKTAMFNVVEQALGEVVDLVVTLQTVLSNNGFIVPITVTVSRLGERTVH